MFIYGTWSESKKSFVPELVAAILNGKLTPSQIAGLIDPRKLNGGSNERIAAEFLQALRQLVDDWIDSGKREGFDSPIQREVPMKVLTDYTNRNPPLTLIGGDGRIGFSLEPSTLTSIDGRDAALDRATWEFVKLMDSPFRNRLSRCDECGVYFARRRLPKQDEPNKFGSFCEKHRGKGRAKSTKTARENHREEMLDAAAAVLLEFERIAPGAEWRQWGVQKLNKRMARVRLNNPNAFPAISSNWLTRHEAEIEARARRRRKHATR